MTFPFRGHIFKPNEEIIEVIAVFSIVYKLLSEKSFGKHLFLYFHFYFL